MFIYASKIIQSINVDFFSSTSYFLISPGHIPYKTSLRPEKDQKSVPIARPTCERRTLVFQVFEVLWKLCNQKSEVAGRGEICDTLRNSLRDLLATATESRELCVTLTMVLLVVRHS